VETSGGRRRVIAHNIERVLHIPTQSTALLALLMLRGPQTAGELRLNCGRLHKLRIFLRSRSFLVELAECAAGGLVVELPRQPVRAKTLDAPALRRVGHRGARGRESGPHPSCDVTVGEIAALKANVARLEAEVSELRAMMGKLCAELGVSAG